MSVTTGIPSLDAKLVIEREQIRAETREAIAAALEREAVWRDKDTGSYAAFIARRIRLGELGRVTE